MFDESAFVHYFYMLVCGAMYQPVSLRRYLFIFTDSSGARLQNMSKIRSLSQLQNMQKHISASPVNISVHEKQHTTNTSQNMPRTRAPPPSFTSKKSQGHAKHISKLTTCHHHTEDEARRVEPNMLPSSDIISFFSSCTVDCKHLSVNTRNRVEGWGAVVSSLCLFNWIFFFFFGGWM